METKINIASLEVMKSAIENKIEALREDMLAVNRLIERFSMNGNHAAEAISPAKKEAKVQKKAKPGRKSKEEGKIMFSSYMLDFMKDNPGKEFDYNEIAEYMLKGINEGKVSKVTGVVKDEVGKRMYQFIKRGDAVRTISGAYQYCRREDSIRP